MPTNRRAKRRTARAKVSQAAVDAWQRNDYMALHRAVGLAPFEYSPLPCPLEALGIPATPPAKPETCMELSYAKVKAIQDELYAVAGEPGVLPMPRVTLTVDTETLNPIQKLILEGLATPQQTPKPPLSDGAREAVDEHPRTREDF